MTPDTMIDILGAFLFEVKQGNNLQKLLLSGQSLRNYLKAAATCLSLLSGQPVTYYDANTMSQKHPSLHPYLQEMISQRDNWTKPQTQKEPFTYRMLAEHATTLVSTKTESVPRFLRLVHAVWDWLRLGVFTGSRVAEYAQSRLKKGQRFQCIPNTPDAGVWAGQPLAFIRADFQFFDSAHRLVAHSDVFNAHRCGTIFTVHIRFRFDKSPTNFSIRKFARSQDPILNPVDAAVSIFRRANLLRVPLNEPIGVYNNRPSGPFHFMRDYHIAPVLRTMCIRAYPDPTHYLRIHITRLVPHSNRVTAAVCLKLGGAKDEEIAFRLRWHIASVPTYLRECFQDVGQIMTHTLQGAFKTS
jgi:hypothetical protein